jgi:predicted metalloprotease with PDZ domain
MKFGSRRRRFLVALSLLSGLAQAVAARGEVGYEISLEHPEQHLFQVTMCIPNVAGEVTVQIPAWNALYQIRDFSAHIQRVEAFQSSGDTPADRRSTANAKPAAIEKIDKQTWRITAHGTVTVRYASYWDEAGPFATQLNVEHAFINPAMILMYVPERRAEPVMLTISGEAPHWQIASAQDSQTSGSARFISKFSNYDALADNPIEAGKFEEFSIEGLTPEVRVVIHGDSYKKKEVEAELRRICQYEVKLMRGAPYPRYTFILHIGKGASGAGGGMEHSDSTAIFVSSSEYLGSVAAHEFFHLWNVKRIRPATLYPIDYSQEQYTRALWFAEGVTSTYGSYALERSGLWTKQQLYHDLSQQISELEARPANRWQSAEQSSLDAWLEKYPLYESRDESISYYTKGQVLGELLDILIRDRTGNEKSLDDVLRAMNEQFAQAGKGYRDSLDIQLTAEKIAGVSFDDFFKRFVAGAEPLPYSATLQLAGLELRESPHARTTLGITAEPSPAGLLVRTVDSNGPAAAAGLQSGDVVVKWNGADPPRRASDWLPHHKAGEMLHLRVNREGSELEIDFRLGEITETYYDVVEDSHAGEKARQLREGWLHGATNAEGRHASN